MKEIVRPNDGRIHPLTNLLTPNKPYLVLDQNSGQHHVLWWRVFFTDSGYWNGSDWYDGPGADANPLRGRKGQPIDWPKPYRIWELPTVIYQPPQEIASVTAGREHGRRCRKSGGIT